MDHGSQTKSRLTSVILTRELHRLDRAGSMLSITSQWQESEILIFCYKRYTTKQIKSHVETTVPKFRPDLSVRLKDIAEKQVPVRLKLIVVATILTPRRQELAS